MASLLGATFGAVLGAGATAAQTKAHNDREMRLAKDLKESEMAQAHRFHTEEMQQSTELFKEWSANQWLLHHDEMDVAMDLARRETMRDVWQQRQFLNQTVLVVDALMFSSCFVAISQPKFPEANYPQQYFFGAYGVSLGVSCLFLAFSMWAAFKVQSRMGSYNVNHPALVYDCGNAHSDFNSYFHCHCESLRVAATASFFVGTISLLIGAVGAQLIQAEHAFDDILTGIIFAGGIILAILVVILLEICASDKCVEGPEYGGLAHETPGASANAAAAIRRANEDAGATSDTREPFDSATAFASDEIMADFGESRQQSAASIGSRQRFS